MEVTSLVLSIVAVLISGAAFYYTKRQSDSQEALKDIETSRRADEVQAKEAAAAIEAAAAVAAKRANMKISRGQANRIIVANDGPAHAQRVIVSISGHPDENLQPPWPAEPKSTVKEHLPAGSSMRVQYMSAGETAIRFMAHVNWIDSSGSGHAKEEILDID